VLIHKQQLQIHKQELPIHKQEVLMHRNAQTDTHPHTHERTNRMCRYTNRRC